ncbi:hypothetical protein ACFZAU_29340 [Streptomyces sp. NPDC008238]
MEGDLGHLDGAEDPSEREAVEAAELQAAAGATGLDAEVPGQSADVFIGLGQCRAYGAGGLRIGEHPVHIAPAERDGFLHGHESDSRPGKCVACPSP